MISTGCASACACASASASASAQLWFYLAKGSSLSFGNTFNFETLYFLLRFGGYVPPKVLLLLKYRKNKDKINNIYRHWHQIFIAFFHFITFFLHCCSGSGSEREKLGPRVGWGWLGWGSGLHRSEGGAWDVRVGVAWVKVMSWSKLRS